MGSPRAYSASATPPPVVRWAWSSASIPTPRKASRHRRLPWGPLVVSSWSGIATDRTAQQFDSAVGSDSAGRFVIVWDSSYQDGFFSGVFGQRFSPIVPVE